MKTNEQWLRIAISTMFFRNDVTDDKDAENALINHISTGLRCQKATVVRVFNECKVCLKSGIMYDPNRNPGSGGSNILIERGSQSCVRYLLREVARFVKRLV